MTISPLEASGSLAMISEDCEGKCYKVAVVSTTRLQLSRKE